MPHIAPYPFVPPLAANWRRFVSRFVTFYVPLFPEALALARAQRSFIRAAQPGLSSCGARVSASAPGATSYEITLPEPI